MNFGKSLHKIENNGKTIIIEISDLCYLTFPCKHNVIITENNESSELCLGATKIYEFLEMHGFVNDPDFQKSHDYKHFCQNKEYNKIISSKKIENKVNKFCKERFNLRNNLCNDSSNKSLNNFSNNSVETFIEELRKESYFEHNHDVIMRKIISNDDHEFFIKFIVAYDYKVTDNILHYLTNVPNSSLLTNKYKQIYIENYDKFVYKFSDYFKIFSVLDKEPSKCLCKYLHRSFKNKCNSYDNYTIILKKLLSNSNTINNNQRMFIKKFIESDGKNRSYDILGSIIDTNNDELLYFLYNNIQIDFGILESQINQLFFRINLNKQVNSTFIYRLLNIMKQYNLELRLDNSLINILRKHDLIEDLIQYGIYKYSKFEIKYNYKFLKNPQPVHYYNSKISNKLKQYYLKYKNYKSSSQLFSQLFSQTFDSQTLKTEGVTDTLIEKYNNLENKIMTRSMKTDFINIIDHGWICSYMVTLCTQKFEGNKLCIKFPMYLNLAIYNMSYIISFYEPIEIIKCKMNSNNEELFEFDVKKLSNNCYKISVEFTGPFVTKYIAYSMLTIDFEFENNISKSNSIKSIDSDFVFSELSTLDKVFSNTDSVSYELTKNNNVIINSGFICKINK